MGTGEYHLLRVAGGHGAPVLRVGVGGGGGL